MMRMTFAARTLLNFLSVYVGWWACVLGPVYHWPWLGPALMPPLLALHLYFSPTWRGELLFLAVLIPVGFAVDTLFLQFGVLHLVPHSGFPTPWLICLWLLLGISFEGMLVMRRHIGLVFLMGLLSGPLSYFFVTSIEIMRFGHPKWFVIAVHGAAWMGLMPVLFWLREVCLRAMLRPRRLRVVPVEQTSPYKPSALKDGH